jgi:hypothetical protein
MLAKAMGVYVTAISHSPNQKANAEAMGAMPFIATAEGHDAFERNVLARYILLYAPSTIRSRHSMATSNCSGRTATSILYIKCFLRTYRSVWFWLLSVPDTSRSSATHEHIPVPGVPPEGGASRTHVYIQLFAFQSIYVISYLSRDHGTLSDGSTKHHHLTSIPASSCDHP